MLRPREGARREGEKSGNIIPACWTSNVQFKGMKNRVLENMEIGNQVRFPDLYKPDIKGTFLLLAENSQKSIVC